MPLALRALPRRARSVIWVNTVSAAGTGLVLPLLVIYLHEIRGFGYQTATAAVAACSVGALVGAPVLGWVSDRFGRALAVCFSLLIAAVGSLGYAFGDHPWMPLVAGLMQGVGIAGAIAWNAVIAEVVPAKHWSTVFGLNFAVVNAMMGLGGLVGGLVAGQLHSLLVFQVLYALDAASFVITGLVMILVPWIRNAGTASVEPTASRTDDAGQFASYLAVLRDRRMMALLGVVLMLFAAAYSQLVSGVPAVLLSTTSLRSSQLGILFAVDTATIVVTQFTLLPVIKHRSPKPVMVMLSVLWAAFWGLLALSALANDVAGTMLVASLGIMCFAVCESLLTAIGPALVNSWANGQNRGRYNAAYGFASSVGFTVGPLVAGAAISGGQARAFAIIAGLICLAVAYAVMVSGFLPARRLAELTSDTVTRHDGGSGQPSPEAIAAPSDHQID